MLLSTFISRALSYASVDGAPFIDGDAERVGFVGEKLAEFTIDCPCIFHDDISMSVVAGTRLYDFDTYTATFTRAGQTVMALSNPVQVWSPSGALLSDGRGYPGPTPSEELEDNRLSLTTTGTPNRWGFMLLASCIFCLSQRLRRHGAFRRGPSIRRLRQLP